MVPAKKSSQGKTKECSVISVVDWRRYYQIHKHTNGKGFKKHVPLVFKEIQEFTIKATGAPDMHTDTKLNPEVQAKRKRNGHSYLYMDVQKAVLFLGVIITLTKIVNMNENDWFNTIK